MLMRTRFRDAKLSTKFNLVLILVFVVGISLSGAALANILHQRAQFEVTAQVTLLMQTMNSIRDYNQAHITPLLTKELETQAYIDPVLGGELETVPPFVPESVPTYAIREVFENLRQNENYTNFSYKDATLNPTNIKDKADEFETALIERFRKEPELKELSGFRVLPQGKVFYIARPFAITDSTCLQCHTTPDMAPKSQITTYGSINGFGWELNDPITAQVVSVPAESVLNNINRSVALVMRVLFGVFTIVILLINFLLRKTVIQRIKRISKAAHAISTDEMSIDLKDNAQDEIGDLAAAFGRMKSSLEISMEMLNQRKS
jgi:HAMP domain-containing protein